MTILGFIVVMIFALIMMDYIYVPITNERNEKSLRNELHLHWLFVIGSIFGKGIYLLQNADYIFDELN